MLALSSDLLGLQFLRGMVATVNPCGFVLLPTYLMYFLGIEAATGVADERASVRRALVVGSAVSAGFIAVFLAIGVLTEFVTQWLFDNVKYLTVVIGVAFVALGAAILIGYRPRFATPHIDRGGRTRSIGSMFAYGIAYAVASIGCAMPIFLTAVIRPGRRDGFVTGVVNVVFYALGMGLVVVALTVSLALASQALLRVLRTVMRHVDQLAGAFMLLSGAYLIYYFVVIDLGDVSARDPVVDAVTRWQTRVINALAGRWQLVAAVLGVIVLGAALYALRRPSVQSPSGDR
jgi:cytochrome c-type biogenesis protein